MNTPTKSLDVLTAVRRAFALCHASTFASTVDCPVVGAMQGDALT